MILRAKHVIARRAVARRVSKCTMKTDTPDGRLEWVRELLEMVQECHEPVYPSCEYEAEALIDWIWSDCRTKWPATKEEIVEIVSQLI